VFGAGTGSMYWKVFKNTGSGFATTATTWTVPDSQTSDGFYAAEVNTGTGWWTLRDLDGDGRPELVQTGDPSKSGGYVFGVGSASMYWKVFKNTGSGFITTASTWTVPSSNTSDGFYAAERRTGSSYWTLRDLTGDGKPELVQTGDPARTGGYVFGLSSGSPYWRVFGNTGSGFSTMGMTWAVPDAETTDGFFAAESSAGTGFWQTIDVDGDGKPDLVQSGDPSRTGGYIFGAGSSSMYWKVFRNGGAGFATSAVAWIAPGSGTTDGFFGASAGSGGAWWVTQDLTGDKRADLIQTGDPARTGGYVFGAGTAMPYWRLFKGIP
jgi:hypothetical protein